MPSQDNVEDAREIRGVHNRIEDGFERWGRFVVRRRVGVVLASLALSAFLASGLSQLTANFSVENFLLPGDDALETYRSFREEFGWEDVTIVAVETGGVFDPLVLARLRELHHALERNIPYTKDVTSLVNARWTRAEDNSLIVEEFMVEWPATRADAEVLRARAFSNPLYRNHFFTEDGDTAAVLVALDTEWSAGPAEADFEHGFDSDRDARPETTPMSTRSVGPRETTEHIEAIYRVAARFDGPGFRIRVAGSEALGQRLQSIATTNVSLFVVLVIVAISIFLMLLTRRASGALLPLCVVVLALTSTFGFMGWAGIPFTVPTQILPPFLVTVGVCDSVHILAIVDQGRARGLSREESIVAAVRHSGLAVVMTSLTTAGGLLSFLSVALSPVADIGRVAPFGILIAMALSLTLLPALLSMSPIRPRTSLATGAGVGRLLAATAEMACNRPVATLATTGLLVVLAAGGVAKVRFGHDPLRWLLPEDPIRQALEEVNAKVGGIGAIELVLDTGQSEGLYDPAILQRIESAVDHARGFEEGPVAVGKVTSIVDIVKEIHRALHEDDPAYYRIPDNRKLIAQELLLFENTGWDDLESVTDWQFRTARVSLRVGLADSLHYGPFLDRLDSELREILGPQIELTWTGQAVLGSRAFSLVLVSLFRSYVLALAIITPLMVMLVGDLRQGLISVVPNLLPVCFTLALMGWLSIPMNATTLLVGSIIIGLAVDDTIHFMHHFARFYEQSGDPRAAIQRTLETTGTAMLVTSLALATGFAVFLLGDMRPIRHLGLLASFASLTAFLADVVVTPALLVLVVRRRAPGAAAAANGANRDLN